MLLQSPLSDSVLSPRFWPFHLDWLPPTAYLVGGCVRDAILNYRSAYLDLDFVVPEQSVETARAIARHCDAGFVVLDEARQIARVVFPGATADFALQVGDTLEADLYRRDFTVNAIAYSPHQQVFHDPLGGRQDLEERRIRMVSAENLRDDPLRLLRAYRQAAQLNFTVDSETRSHLRQFAPLLSRVAPERIRGELNYLLHLNTTNSWLRSLWNDGLLNHSFPDASANGLRFIEQVDPAAVAVTDRWPHLRPEVYRPLSDRQTCGERRTLLATVKLLGLVSTEPEPAKQTLRAMKYSRAEMALITLLQQGLVLLQAQAVSQWQRCDQYYLFRLLRQQFPAMIIVAAAQGWPLPSLEPLVQAYLDPSNPTAHPRHLLSGQDLMQALSIAPGPIIGQLLSAVELAQAEGTVINAADALVFAGQQLDRIRTAASAPSLTQESEQL